jgi:hypothetical protein
LSAVVDDQGNGAVYNYDPVGNLLSITPAGPPLITGVAPSGIDAGTSVGVTINGSGLLADSVTLSNPDIQIDQFAGSNISVRVVLTIPNPTPFGPTTLTVQTPKGAASAEISVRQPIPVITRIDPDSGIAGATVLIEGDGFGTKAGSNRVTFAGAGGARLIAPLLNEERGRLTVGVPSGVAAGPVRVEVGDLTSNGVFFKTLTLTGIVATAEQGIPSDATRPSANANRLIELQGVAFNNNMRILFSTTDDSGVSATEARSPLDVSPDGTLAHVAVPARATTGLLLVEDSVTGGRSAPLLLQIVPTLSSFTLPFGEAIRPGVTITLSGSGFKEGGTTVAFPGAPPVAAADVFLENRRLTVTVPSGVTGGPLTVQTDGGMSPPIQLDAPSITGLLSTAARGSANIPAEPSANIGQSLLLEGEQFTSRTRVLFPIFDTDGLIIPFSVFPDDVAPDGRSLTVTVPPAAVSGLVAVRDEVTGMGNAGVVQIVPTLDTVNGAVTAGSEVEIVGSGFTPDGTRIQFPGVAGPVDADRLSIVPSGGTRAAVVVPSGVESTGSLFVITDAGVSNPFDLVALGNEEVEPNGAPATATPLALDQLKSGRIDPAGDLDFYRFDAGAETFYIIDLLVEDPAGPAMNMLLTLLAPDGVTVLDSLSGRVGPEGISLSLFPEATGTYFIKVEENNGQGDPDFRYQLKVSLEVAF